MNNHSLETYAGLPVADFPAEKPPSGPVAWRLRQPEDEPEDVQNPARILDALIAEATEPIEALVIGFWSDQFDDAFTLGDVRDVLVERAARLPDLRSLFFGDITYHENELGWIEQCDVTPLARLPLTRFEVRGSDGLLLDPVENPALRVLRFETAGLPGPVTAAVAASDLPALEELDLWLGTPRYNGTTTVEHLRPVLDGARLPSLRHLSLQNGDFHDEVAAALAGAPVVARLETLSLARGTLTDVGAEALLSGQPLTHLRRLDLRHHFLSEEMAARVLAALPGVEVLIENDRDLDPADPYVAIGE
ncbi:STM4015 family protein [Actinocorallia longicatena]|uniref:Leucine-rich repeat domain-containing protein n=1 Tax=Actinocorallia longicatena TaxID=111803 RepID=A0ABP6QHT4_9ACTN